jgi:2-oxoacid:acceptor oxidoreductase delta subunit (pyruvate/2-ketoisovalerate family)
MAKLMRWQALPRAGVADPREVERPSTGDWRTTGKPVLDTTQCVNCLLCWMYCPDSAIVLAGTTLTGIDYDVCKGCELCVEVCPAGAIEMVSEVAS